MKDALGMPQSLLVIGGGSDIARATVLALAREGTDDIRLAARRPDELEPLAVELGAQGVAVELLPFDADAVDSHPLFVEAAFAGPNDVDLVLVAFGVLGEQAKAERDHAAAVSVLHTNFVGAASVMTLVARRLVDQGHGTIAVLSSVAGERVRRSNYVYGASKAGLDGFSQGLGLGLEGTGVDVMVVRPGFVRTKMTAGLDSPPFSTTPERVAEAVLDGLRRGAHTVWAPPALRFVMSTVRHLPRAIFRRLPV